ncbi:AAA family ATPase [Butyrivibrio sp. XPD2006]|uniref:AAA family ATPase n=1 Tax=Butyrivibrio sp. XPD2006 TaxID=1280668 RepID=UPI0003B33865|nr:AAA family ATPase [Butyrivibrio sp. XPD2006]
MNEEIQELQAEIDALPKGSVTKKLINNTYYYYHQWKDASGKRHYDIVSEIEAFGLKEKIVRRRELEKRLKALAKEFEKYDIGYHDDSQEPELMTNAMYGEELSDMVSVAREFEKRDCYAIIDRYIHSPAGDNVCLLYGLRRTGKTTIIRQVILNMNDKEFSKAVYIKAKQSDTMADINKDLKNLRRHGFRYVFVDEVTLINDFIDSASLFSDVYAAGGMKIVLSGSDSLGLFIASNEELYDRAVTVHTTFIPFREHARLLGINSVDEYIRYGGTLKAGELNSENKDVNSDEASFRDDESTHRYIDTAICRNIQHSLKFYEDGGHFRHLKKLYEADELTNAINRVIQDMNHEFTKEVILGNKEIPGELCDTSDKLKKQEQIPEVVLEVRNYLREMEVVEYVEPLGRYVFTQPGIRYCQAEAFVLKLLQSNEARTLSEREKTQMEHMILGDIKRRMVEDTVFLETQKELPKSKKTFKLQFDTGELYMVLYDTKTDTCELYEMLHDDNATKVQDNSLLKKENCDFVQRKYGKIVKKVALYQGKSDIGIDGCQYHNIADYLRSLSDATR